MTSEDRVVVKAKLRNQKVLKRNPNGGWVIESIWIVDESDLLLTNGLFVAKINGETGQTNGELELLLKKTGGSCALTINLEQPSDTALDDESLKEGVKSAGGRKGSGAAKEEKSEDLTEQTMKTIEQDSVGFEVDLDEPNLGPAEQNTGGGWLSWFTGPATSTPPTPQPASTSVPANNVQPATIPPEIHLALTPLKKSSTANLVENQFDSTPPDPDEAEQQQPQKKAEALTLNFNVDEGEPFGPLLDDKLTVISVSPGTAAEDKIKRGDVVLELNGKKIEDRNHYFRLLARAFPTLTIKIYRDTDKTAELDAHSLPEHLERLVNRRSGYDFYLVAVDCNEPERRPLGMAIDTLLNKVIVTQLRDKSSASAAGIQVLDRIMAVDGEPVSDKEVVKRMILDRGGKFEALLERAEDPAILTSIRVAVDQRESAGLARETESWATFDMPPDVQEISESERSRRSQDKKSGKEMVAKSVRTPSPHRTSVRFADQHKEYAINSDIDPNKKLRKPAAI